MLRATVESLANVAAIAANEQSLVRVCPHKLAELCKAWLALDAAPEVEVTKRSATFGHGDSGNQWVIGDSYNPPPEFVKSAGSFRGTGVRVRLVPTSWGE